MMRREERPDQSNSHFNEEAKIIARNETHTVLAVRVENAFFTRNAILLASLANIILLGEPDLSSPAHASD